jgi:hypothetical protein
LKDEIFSVFVVGEWAMQPSKLVGETERVGGEANSSKLRVCGMGEGVDSAVEAGLGGNGGIARLGGEEPEVAHVLEFEDPESVEENKLPILVRGA